MMQLNDSKRRRSRARFLRKQKRPLWCAVLLWFFCAPYVLVSVGIVWEATLIPPDSNEYLFSLAFLAFPLVLIALAHPLLGCLAFAVVAWGYWRLIRRVRTYLPALIPSLLFLTPVFAMRLRFSPYPLRWGFWSSHLEFEQRLNEELVNPRPSMRPDTRRRRTELVGSYTVHDICTDSHGHVHFLLPEEGFFYPQSRDFFRGFVHDPSLAEKPFGWASYRLKPLYGDWYYFTAVSE